MSTDPNLSDFRCMRQGEHLSAITEENSHLIKPLHIDNGKKNSVLLLLHGFSSTPAVFRLLSPEFKGYDSIIAPALPGHASSVAQFGDMKKERLLDSVSEITARLCKEYAHVDVLGLSMGGLLATYLSKQFNLRHLYLLAPALDLHLNLPAMLQLANVLTQLGFQRLRAKAGNLYTDKNCEIAYRQLPISAIIEMLTLVKELDFTVPTCPTDVFLGEHDAVVNSELVAKRFEKHTNIDIHWLKNSAHVLPLDGDIGSIIKTVNGSLPPQEIHQESLA